MNNFPHDILGPVRRQSFTIRYNPASKKTPILRGSPRAKSTDLYPTMTANVELVFDYAQFAAWQSFWASLQYGAKWFQMVVNSGGQTVEDVKTVHALTQYSATLSSRQKWHVSLQLEVMA